MRFGKPQRQPIAALLPLVMHATSKASGGCRNRRLSPPPATLPPIETGIQSDRIRSRFNARDQRSAIALQLDCYFQAIVFCATVHNDVGDSFLKAKLNREQGIGRQHLRGPGVDPSSSILKDRRATQDGLLLNWTLQSRTPEPQQISFIHPPVALMCSKIGGHVLGSKLNCSE